MEWAIVLPLVAFALLAGLFALFLRRAGRLIAATRDVERFRRQVADLAARSETSLNEICARSTRFGGARSPRPRSSTTSRHRSRRSTSTPKKAGRCTHRPTAAGSATTSSPSWSGRSGRSR
jgi:hypothetical protein